jgi:hypothetical protein
VRDDARVATTIVPHLALASVAGIVGGLGLFWRGLAAFRAADRIADTSGSRISSLAVGEVRLTGIVEPAELLLTSPLQSRACVWYRAKATEHSGKDERVLLEEERGVGFRLRDETGTVRVFPRGATWAVSDRFSDASGIAGEQPPGLALRTGDAIALADPTREDQVRDLLTVRDARLGWRSPMGLIRLATGRRRYREARVEPGDVVTLIAFVEPFDQLPDPGDADQSAGPSPAGLGARPSDEAMAADLADARRTGILAPDAATAWGNAAIPGFGIGKPVREPDLDAGARPLPLADRATADRIERTFDIAPEDLIVAARADVPLLISLGSADAAAAHHRSRFLLGLLGAVVAIGSALGLAVMVTGGLVG